MGNPVPGGGARTGPRTTIPDSDPENIRSIIRENDTADILSDKGYNVEQNPVVPGPKNPDYRINGIIYDNYAPSTDNVRNIWTVAKSKIEVDQAKNIVIDLFDSNADVSVLKKQFEKWDIEGMESIMILERNGAVTIIKGK